MTYNALRRSIDVLPARRLKIAVFEEACAGGSGRHVADLASHFAAAGHAVHLLYSPTHIDDRFRDGVSNLREFGGCATPINIRHNVHPSDVRMVAEVRQYLLKHGPFDIFHCHSTKAGFVGRLAAFGLGIPTIYTPHAFLTMSPVCDPISYWGAQLIERTLAKTTDAFICVSEEEMEHARSLGISPERLRLIPNGMVLSDANESKSQRLMVRRELALSETDVCIGAVGRLVAQKSFHVLVEAFSLAAPQLARNVRLIVVGTGPLLPALKALAKNLAMQDRIDFVGKLPGLRTMAAFDIFALSSCCEGHPYAFIEALSLGLPIVTTAIGGARISVQNGVNGFISPIGDAKSLANSFVKLTHSPALRAQMARASLRIANEFTLENMLNRTSKAYEGILETRGYLTQAAGAGR
jgi:glycosyltransferase involved in cell wall biosynthesis